MREVGSIRRIAVTVLCEDEAHRTFASAFLKRMNLPTRRWQVIQMGGKGRVLSQFPEELLALRKRGSETHLIVLVDADEQSYEDIERILRLNLASSQVAPLSREDRVILLMPRWEIDNWVRCLLHGDCDEGRHRADISPTDAKDAARLLADYCRARKLPPKSLPSLQRACEQWQTYLQRHSLP